MKAPNRSAREQALENRARELRVGGSLRASCHRVFKFRILIPVPFGQDELREEDERHLADDLGASGTKEVSDILVGHVSLENHGAAIANHEWRDSRREAEGESQGNEVGRGNLLGQEQVTQREAGERGADEGEATTTEQ